MIDEDELDPEVTMKCSGRENSSTGLEVKAVPNLRTVFIGLGEATCSWAYERQAEFVISKD